MNDVATTGAFDHTDIEVSQNMLAKARHVAERQGIDVKLDQADVQDPRRWFERSAV